MKKMILVMMMIIGLVGCKNIVDGDIDYSKNERNTNEVTVAPPSLENFTTEYPEDATYKYFAHNDDANIFIEVYYENKEPVIYEVYETGKQLKFYYKDARTNKWTIH